jgi:predicted ATP-binding protein involved in virulence
MNLQIKSLVVQECGPLRDVEISFTNSNGTPRPVTVIGGANGSGKTTILELIFALVHSLQYKSLSDMPKFPILNRTSEAEISLLIKDKDVRTTIARHTDGLEFHRSYSSSAPVGALREAIRDDNLTAFLPIEVHRATINQQKALAPTVLYFPHYRRIVPVQGTGISRENASYEWTYRYEVVQSFEGSLNAYLVWLEYAQTDTFNTATQFLNETVFLDKAISHVDRPNLQTMIKLTDGVTHPLDELSSGEQNLLIIMLELWRRLLPGSVVLIDEIENSLHPAFQHRLAEALLKLQARIPFQLIVTTHAPAFLDAFGPDSALILTEF